MELQQQKSYNKEETGAEADTKPKFSFRPIAFDSNCKSSFLFRQIDFDSSSKSNV